MVTERNLLGCVARVERRRSSRGRGKCKVNCHRDRSTQVYYVHKVAGAWRLLDCGTFDILSEIDEKGIQVRRGISPWSYMPIAPTSRKPSPGGLFRIPMRNGQ